MFDEILHIVYSQIDKSSLLSNLQYIHGCLL